MDFLFDLYLLPDLILFSICLTCLFHPYKLRIMIGVGEVYENLELIKFKKELYYHYLLNHCLA